VFKGKASIVCWWGSGARLRLQEAPRLMLAGHLGATTVGFQVGYKSPSQFSREYGHLFGRPPKRHHELAADGRW
jgi:transcriptional regulator GlxA family with amidase domain